MIALILPLLFFINIHATDFRDAYKGKIHLESTGTPAEYQILIDSINHYELSKSDKDEVLTDVILSDTFFSRIPKNELYILIKMETYKSVLSFFKTSDYKTARVNQSEINELMKIERKYKEDLSPFAHWILKAVIRDLNIIIKYKYYQTYLTQKSQNKSLKNLELLKLDKKITLLTPWIKTFTKSSPEEINLLTRPLHFDLLRKLAFLSKTIYQTSSFEKSPKLASLDKLKLFKYSRELTTQESTLKKIDDVIGNIELFPSKEDNNTEITDLPKPSNDWIPKDDLAPLKVKKSELFPKPDPNYQRPDSLPEPVNDWLLEI
ncbi:hypothetical protein [Halobacteriovorax sp. JY17]|uniref:hypothetical protein n=1 Tax=Halobacteriovorax sp. JY17 TaxID=2014617 RepID=UPI000C478775|nr:hypothetical protein [Halobacteriovorax sp. JY17]PIK14592.1 MAG: hypothetical protein CES88_09645 [Halobacteriovorax sp. JY17]